MKERDRKLGVGASIKRRDFIGGVSVALSGSLLSCPWAKTETPRDPTAFPQASQDFAASCPPISTGTHAWVEQPRTCNHAD